MSKKLVLVIVAVGVIGFSAWRVASYRGQPGDTDQTEQTTQPAGFDKSKHSIDQPGSLWWVVNKNRPLPAGYAPPDLAQPDVPLRSKGDEGRISQQLVEPLQAMVAAAEAEGVKLMLVSGYRSYSLQVSVYNQNVRELGQAEADQVSARPGTSEHQTGLSLDIGAVSRKCELETCFGDTPEGQWVAAHAHEYGFVIRYPEGKQPVTGYDFEPWHLRYIGPELANELRNAGQTMEEFFGL